MKIGVAKAAGEGETRVAMTPSVGRKLIRQGIELVIESGAGAGASASDDAFREVGATIADEPGGVWGECDIVLSLDPPNPEGIKQMKEGAALLGMLAPYQRHDIVHACREAKVTAFAMEVLPRISRAQAADTLSSQANIGGYKAVLIAANHCPKVFPMMITAAGTLSPAKVFVLGAGVAGLQAIATAKRLGAVVEAFDVRAATKEQVESLGGRFVELPQEEAQDDKATGGYAKEQTEEQQKKQAELLAKHVTAADAVITTAAVPGKAPPMLVPQDVVDQMLPGSVVLDMAASPDHGRGNCEATKPGEVYTTDRGVTLVGTLNLPSLVPVHASQVFANNMNAFLKEILDVPKEGEPSVKINLEDDMVKGACVTHDGEIVHEQVKAVVTGDQ
ncbi:MAG: Re/Si-specific NAD(P)(+) transhydrogenase subunit alpha [Phycisphaeraceae bacterium]